LLKGKRQTDIVMTRRSLKGWQKDIHGIKWDESTLKMGAGLPKVHAGFKTSADEVGPDVRRSVEELRRLTKSDYGEVYTGHSRGGALATFAAVEAKNAGAAVKLYTINAPETGNSGWARQVEAILGPKNIVAMVNRNDPVSDMLSRFFPGQWTHAGRRIWYHGKEYSPDNLITRDNSNGAAIQKRIFEANSVPEVIFNREGWPPLADGGLKVDEIAILEPGTQVDQVKLRASTKALRESIKLESKRTKGKTDSVRAVLYAAHRAFGELHIVTKVPRWLYRW
jgi:hypothetical protein